MMTSKVQFECLVTGPNVLTPPGGDSGPKLTKPNTAVWMPTKLNSHKFEIFSNIGACTVKLDTIPIFGDFPDFLGLSIDLEDGSNFRAFTRRLRSLVAGPGDVFRGQNNS